MMNTLYRTLMLILLVGTLPLFTLSGCATTQEEADKDRNVSTIPWNRPQRWEGMGQLGGMTGGGGGGGGF